MGKTVRLAIDARTGTAFVTGLYPKSTAMPAQVVHFFLRSILWKERVRVGAAARDPAIQRVI